MKTTIIALHIVPKASKNQIVGWVEDGKGGKALKIKIAAAPEDGKANAELIKFLSREWKIPKSSLDIVGGAASRHKLLKINKDIASLPLPA